MTIQRPPAVTSSTPFYNTGLVFFVGESNMINPAAPNYHNTPVSSLRLKYGYKSVNTVRLEPDVTIITPFNNPGSVFTETIQAILCQSFQNFERIICHGRRFRCAASAE
jgi:hypothetical protein